MYTRRCTKPISFGQLQQMKHSGREDVWTNRCKEYLYKRRKMLRNQMANGKLRVLRAITQHSLGNNSPEVGSRPRSAEGLEPLMLLV